MQADLEDLPTPFQLGIIYLAIQAILATGTFGGVGMRDHSEFVGFLEQQARTYRRLLEDMFGQGDQRFVFGSIKQSIDKGDVPHTNFPNGFHFNGGCVVDIHISEWPWQHCCYGQGTWQLAHESVHLLDPGVDGTATFLEEGLATWFQDEPTFQIDVVKKYIERGTAHTQHYTVAKELARIDHRFGNEGDFGRLIEPNSRGGQRVGLEPAILVDRP